MTVPEISHIILLLNTVIDRYDVGLKGGEIRNLPWTSDCLQYELKSVTPVDLEQRNFKVVKIPHNISRQW